LQKIETAGMKYKNKISGLLAGLGVLMLTGCYKNSTVYSDTGTEITRTVSFSNDILPFLDNSCNISGCHNSGGRAPELSTANAYTSLTNGGYINVEDPSASLLYLWMTGKKGTPMPVSGINKEYNALVLAWIKQGAINN
jgi:hypothetical protein